MKQKHYRRPPRVGERCLVDGEGEDPRHNLTARTPGNRLVRLTGDEGLIGQFVDVKITGANKWSLSGEPA